jgi:hypothetical protein
MKILYVLLILSLFICFSCEKDNPETADEPYFITFPGNMGTNDNSTIRTIDNDIVICGGSGISENNILLMKLSENGNIIWRKDINAGKISVASSVVENKSNNLFVCGMTSKNYDNTGYDMLLIKTNPYGDTLWTKTYGDTRDNSGSNIIETIDGNILMGGNTYVWGYAAGTGILLIKTNYNGDTIWTNLYTDKELDKLNINHLKETRNGEYLVIGRYLNDRALHQMYLFKVDKDGNKIWGKELESITTKTIYSAIELQSSELLVCGTNFTNDSTQKMYVMKANNLGNPIWEKEYGDNGNILCGMSMKQNNDGTISITGYSSYTNSDVIVLEIDKNGNQIFFEKIVSQYNDQGLNLITSMNENIIITGNRIVGELDRRIFMSRIVKSGDSIKP